LDSLRGGVPDRESYWSVCGSLETLGPRRTVGDSKTTRSERTFVGPGPVHGGANLDTAKRPWPMVPYWIWFAGPD